MRLLSWLRKMTSPTLATREPHVISVAEVAGPYCITAPDGETIYRLIRPRLEASERVVLEFSGVEIYATPFFNSSIGLLLRDFAPAQLNVLLAFRGLSSDGKELALRVIANARNYYTNAQVHRSVDSVILEHAKTA